MLYNKPNYNPGESLQEMVQKVVALNATCIDLKNTNANLMTLVTDMKETISKLENTVSMLNKKITDLEDELAGEKKRRSSDSDSSNPPPLIKK